jgi:3-oxoacyl-[acyl-carrier protein] reductase
MKMLMSKTYLISGASQGIGFELAKILSKSSKVIAIARSEDKLKLLEAFGVEIVRSDISSLESVLVLKKYLSDKQIRLDGIVNNAGVLINKPFLEQSDEDFDNSFNVNVFGAMRLIRELYLLLNKDAHILNISSMGGFQGSSKYPGLSSYSASKGALSILTECLAAELENVSVNCLCLGAVQTEMLAEAFPGYEAPVKPHEMAEYISNFLQTAHKMMNGKIIPVALSNP